MHVHIQCTARSQCFPGSYNPSLLLLSAMKASCTIKLQNACACSSSTRCVAPEGRGQGDTVCKGSHLSSPMGTLHPPLSPSAEPSSNIETRNLKFHILAASQHYSIHLGFKGAECEKLQSVSSSLLLPNTDSTLLINYTFSLNKKTVEHYVGRWKKKAKIKKMFLFQNSVQRYKVVFTNDKVHEDGQFQG